MNLSHEYVGSLAILVVMVLKSFGIEIENDAVSGLLVGAVALWVAIRRKARGDISVLGVKNA